MSAANPASENTEEHENLPADQAIAEELSSSLSTATSRRSATGRNWYVLFLLTLVYSANIGQRFMMSTLTEPIKAAFALSDTAVGSLTGPAAALFFVLAGLPMGFLADRTNRRNLIAFCLLFVSAMTTVGGLVSSFLLLVVTRIGVGIGTAAVTPASISLLSDKFTLEKRGLAMTLFTLGIVLGATAGTTCVGWLTDSFGWRVAMIVFGLISAPIAVLIWWSMDEPRRGATDIQDGSATPASIRQTLRFVWSQRALCHLVMGQTVCTLWCWGLLLWTPAFLSRSHDMTAGQAGALLGPIYAVGGTAAIIATAGLMKWLEPREPKFQVWFLAFVVGIATVSSIIAYSAASVTIVRLMLWILVPTAYLYNGPVFALGASLATPGMRGQVISLMSLLAVVGELIIGFPLVGVGSDVVAAHVANPQESMRYVLIALAFTGFWAAYHFAAAAQSLRQNIDRARSGVI
jgi:predicted MFS family arabinose efflux permease